MTIVQCCQQLLQTVLLQTRKQPADGAQSGTPQTQNERGGHTLLSSFFKPRRGWPGARLGVDRRSVSGRRSAAVCGRDTGSLRPLGPVAQHHRLLRCHSSHDHLPRVFILPLPTCHNWDLARLHAAHPPLTVACTALLLCPSFPLTQSERGDAVEARARWEHI